MDNLIKIGGGSLHSYEKVYSQTSDIGADGSTYYTVTFNNINVKGFCAIVISQTFVSQTSRTDDKVTLQDFKIGDESATHYMQIERYGPTQWVDAYSFGTTYVAFADLTNVSTISYKSRLVIAPTCNIFKLS